jgi:hypothetical protein
MSSRGSPSLRRRYAARRTIQMNCSSAERFPDFADLLAVRCRPLSIFRGRVALFEFRGGPFWYIKFPIKPSSFRVRLMRADEVFFFQIMIVSLLCAVLTIKLSIDHPEWSPDGLTELRALPHQMDEKSNALATP